jgi:hypothetical protein
VSLVGQLSEFQRFALHSSSATRIQSCSGLFYTEDEGSTVLQNVTELLNQVHSFTYQKT